MADEKDRDPQDRSAFPLVVRDVVNAITGTEWFGPLQPLKPIVPQPATPRVYQYRIGANVQYLPRGEEPVSFFMLHQLADLYDILRLFIEKRKRQISTVPWQVRVRKQESESAMAHKRRSQDAQDEIEEVTAFFQRPDGEHTWQAWLNAYLEEVFVTDALSLYVRRNRGKQVIGIDVIDGSLIHRIIDPQGRTPMPPDPAYQQIINGVIYANLTTDDLLYRPRNYRARKIYGYSPVEQIITTVNIALRREMHQLAFYTEGNVPEALAQLPGNWTIDQIDTFQEWFDSVLAGNLKKRRRITFLPELAGSKAQTGGGVQFTKPNDLKDVMDEWLARVIAFAFDVSPQALVQQMNRATAQTAQEAAEEEGLKPTLDWIAETQSDIIANVLGYPDLEWAFQTDREVDKAQQAEIHSTYIKVGALSIDEVREELGREPIGQANAVLTTNGLVPVGEAAMEMQAAAAEGLLDGSEGLASGMDIDTSALDGKSGLSGDEMTADLGKRRLPADARGAHSAFVMPVQRKRLRNTALEIAKTLNVIGKRAAAAVRKRESLPAPAPKPAPIMKVYGSVADLPAEQVKGFSAHEKQIFLSAWNAAYKEYGDEGKAFATAHAAVNKHRAAGK